MYTYHNSALIFSARRQFESTPFLCERREGDIPKKVACVQKIDRAIKFMTSQQKQEAASLHFPH